jgi:hypothetical protein
MWNILGNEDSIQLRVMESGFQKITGTALSHEVFTHSYYNPTGENEDKIKPWFDEKARFDENINQLEFSWSIKPSNATIGDISGLDGEEPTLYERCQATPELSHIFIRFFDSTDDFEISFKDRHKSITASIVLPPDTFNRIWNLFNRVLLEPVSYQMCINFSGWMRERQNTPEDMLGKYKDSWLTMEEFLSGKAYYCNGIDFSIFKSQDETKEIDSVIKEKPALPTENSETLQELLPILFSPIKRSLKWITFLLLMIAATLIFK